LDASQSAAVAELDEQLKAEADVLIMQQQIAKQQLDVNHQRECRELEQKIEIRRTLLDNKVMLLTSTSHNHFALLVVSLTVYQRPTIQHPSLSTSKMPQRGQAAAFPRAGTSAG